MPNTQPTEQREMHILATYLDLKGLLWLHIPNEGKRSPRQGALLKRLGLKAGAPDAIILQRSPAHHRYAMVELKRRDGGRVSKEQVAFLNRAEQHGWHCYVAHGAGDAIEWLKSLGW